MRNGLSSCSAEQSINLGFARNIRKHSSPQWVPIAVFGEGWRTDRSKPDPSRPAIPIIPIEQGYLMYSPTSPRCQHTRTNGTRCGSPALRHDLIITVPPLPPLLVKKMTAMEFAITARRSRRSGLLKKSLLIFSGNATTNARALDSE